MVDFVIDHAETPPEIVLEQIPGTIVERLHPRRIILIGSRARGDARPDSDYDVVVEFHADKKTAWEYGRQIYGFFPDRHWSLNVIERVVGDIERSADDPGTIDWDIVREGKVLYSADGLTTTVLRQSATHVREEPREPPPSVRDWTTNAGRDLEMARLMVRKGDAWNYACFFSQQAAEKFLKALLVWHFVRPQRTHELDELAVDLRAIGVSQPGLEADCKLLAPYAVATRYGDPFSYTEQQGREAVAAAERIAAAIIPLVSSTA